MSLPEPIPVQEDADDVALAEVGRDLQAALGRYVRGTVEEWRLTLTNVEQQYEKARWKGADEREQVEGMLAFTRQTVDRFERLLASGPPIQHQLQPTDVTWHEISATWLADEVAGRALWERLKETARHELLSGKAGATAVEGYDARPMARADYLAVWEALADGLRPTNGAERLLIDGMAQALVMQRHWLQVMVRTEALDTIRRSRLPQDELPPPRLGEAEAIDRAAVMQERFGRTFIRLLTTYRDQRRLFSTLVVSGGQVNIAADGGQQLIANRTVRASAPRHVRPKRRPPHRPSPTS